MEQTDSTSKSVKWTPEYRKAYMQKYYRKRNNIPEDYVKKTGNDYIIEKYGSLEAYVNYRREVVRSITKKYVEKHRIPTVNCDICGQSIKDSVAYRERHNNTKRHQYALSVSSGNPDASIRMR